ncbi:hypothetical protein VTK73DRAFT_7796 [Phialemonium thermophilum]|uniref:Uncharacterized protein n=1 Tax=Phialemonium thermophilum TaxID=223376 RepID=A0ABR3WCI6_9PEZI
MDASTSSITMAAPDILSTPFSALYPTTPALKGFTILFLAGLPANVNYEKRGPDVLKVLEQNAHSRSPSNCTIYSATSSKSSSSSTSQSPEDIVFDEDRLSECSSEITTFVGDSVIEKPQDTNLLSTATDVLPPAQQNGVVNGTTLAWTQRTKTIAAGHAGNESSSVDHGVLPPALDGDAEEAIEDDDSLHECDETEFVEEYYVEVDDIVDTEPTVEPCTSGLITSTWGSFFFQDMSGHLGIWTEYYNYWSRVEGHRLACCHWQRLESPLALDKPNSKVPQLILTDPDGKDWFLDDLTYYPGATNWADLDEDEEEE